MTTTTAATSDASLQKALLLEKYEPIAIVGIGLRLPGDNRTPADFANFLRSGRSATQPIPAERWNTEQFHSDTPGARGKTIQSSGGYLSGIDQFDPKFFNISPKEADYVDPQHRLLLECAWQALESANIDPASLRDSDGGVYVGIGQYDWALCLEELPPDELEGLMGAGTAHSGACGRLSYFLGWRGPCLSVDTACSASLAALHLAVQGLRRRECSIALCGGVNVIHHPRNHIMFSMSNMLSPDGRCKTFDDAADGYGRSEGCAMFALKRLSDAKRDGDSVLALIRGSAVGQDGESGGLTVPNGTAQAILMRDALASGMLEPGDIQYVEAHGTGTPLGDPIEIGAIDSVFGASHTGTPLIVGSVKTNIGHMEAAAGVGGLLKVALQLQEGAIYPHINLKTPSRHIPWDRYQVQLATGLQAWTGKTRRALVNSFGFAGTIASVAMEQAPPLVAQRQPAPADTAMLTVSAKSAGALRPQLEQLHRFVSASPEISIPDLCYTVNVGRSHLNARFAAPIRSRDDLLSRLDKELGRSAGDKSIDRAAEFRAAPVAFLFTGQGSQYLGMGRSLMAQYPLFKAEVERCDRLFAGPLGCSIKAVMLGEADDGGHDINQTLYTQPALFTFEYALAQLWMSWGVAPSVLLGHSIGEIVAATVAGLFSLEDATRLVAVRARLMQSVSLPGGMIAVRAAQSRVAPFLRGHGDVSFGAFNAPGQCVVSGGKASLAGIADALASQGIECKALPVSHAFHSPLMAEVFDAFGTALKEIQFREPTLSFISNLTGKVARFADVGQPAYWVRHIAEPVNFEAGLGELLQRGKHVFVEVGPTPSLISLGRQFEDNGSHLWLASAAATEEAPGQTLRKSLAQIYEAGVAIDWAAYHRPGIGRRIPLPGYVFDRKRHWYPASGAGKRHAPGGAAAPTLLGAEISTAAQRAAGVREFSAQLGAHQPAYLADHLVMGQVVFPGAGFVELLFTAQEAVLGETTRVLQDLRILEPLFLTDEPTDLRTRWTPQPDGSVGLAICSVLGTGERAIERLHVQATLGAIGEGRALLSDLDRRLRASAAACGEPVFEHQGDEVYARYADLGLPYGPEFQRVRGIRQYAEGFAVGDLRGLDTPAAEHLRASILDCAMQTLAGVVDLADAYLPVGFARIELLKKPKADLRCLLQLNTPAGDTPPAELDADFAILEGDRTVALVQGLRLKRVASNASSARCGLHEPRWLKRSLASAKGANGARSVLVVNRCERDFKSVRATLDEAQIGLCFAASAADAGWMIAEQPQVGDVCWFWRSQPALQGEARLREECRQNYTELLALAQTLAQLDPNRSMRLTLVTEGGQWLPGDLPEACSGDALAPASLWGFGHVLLNEQPKQRVTLVDLSPSRATGFDAQPLVDEWLAGDASGSEFQIAYRGRARHVKRLFALQGKRSQENFELKVTEFGQFANILPVPVPDVEPQGDEVSVEIHAAGLNFKDVLNALGMLRQYALDNGLPQTDLPLGFEACGRVVAAGPTAEFAPGDDVIVSQLGCMKRRVTLSSTMVVRKPAGISAAEGASLPAAYVTAHYALHQLAHIRRGDRVLIHAAAGGVGQAAVQLAQLAGAEVYATASPSKHALLRSQGVHHIMNSRTLDFTQEVKWATEGRGVDIVLNSLNKDYVAASVKCLAPGGRFVELGKIGIWSPEQMRAQRPDAQYHNFDLSEFSPAEFNRINKEILQAVTAQIAEGLLRPLPSVTYSLDEVEEAFSVLSQGRNVGKIVLAFPAADPHAVQPVVLKADRTYLVTGGLGALGLQALRKLVHDGARHLAVISRRAVDAAEVRALEQALGADATLTAYQADVASSEDMARVIADIGARLPLAGILHTAGVLADSPVSKQTWDSFDRVLQPKIYGTWNLHQAVAALPALDFFVAYSSVSSVLGATGQSNYASGNAFMDVLMHWRSASGHKSLSVNWGPWAEVGMAAQLTPAQIHGIEERGIRFVKPAKGMNALFDLLAQPQAQAMVGEFDWERYVGNQVVSEALFKVVSPKGAAPRLSIDLASLKHMTKTERDDIIRAVVRAKVASVLRFDSPEDIELDAKFIELGLDSLAAVELKNALESTLHLPLPTSALFDYPGVASFTEYISQQIVPTAAPHSTVGSDSVQAVDQVSDEQAEAELAALRETM